MVDADQNPYSPPLEAGHSEPADVSAPRRGLLLEIIRAFATIFGIIIGWIIIGAGLVQEMSGEVLLGVIVIALACVIGLSSSRRRGKVRKA